MTEPKQYLRNAERLVSDAKHLYDQGRVRSAATLVVVALEQMGQFVEVLTRVSYPDASVHMGIFGDKANAHAKRQDALAGHVMNYAFGAFFTRIMAKRFAQQGSGKPAEDLVTWLMRTQPHELTDEEQLDQRSCPDIAAAHMLLHFARTNTLKDLREYGLYESNNRTFSDDEVERTIDLAWRVRGMLEKSWVIPEPFQLIGVNLPKDITFCSDGKRHT